MGRPAPVSGPLRGCLRLALYWVGRRSVLAGVLVGLLLPLSMGLSMVLSQPQPLQAADRSPDGPVSDHPVMDNAAVNNTAMDSTALVMLPPELVRALHRLPTSPRS